MFKDASSFSSESFSGSNSKACAYIGLSDSYGNITWGVGIHDDIINASIIALISAINRTVNKRGK